MSTKTTQPPAGLPAAGVELWEWITATNDISGVEAVITQLCHVAARLSALREAIASATEPDHRMIAAECKLLAQFARLWSLAGLADDDMPKRKPGRPAGVALRRV